MWKKQVVLLSNYTRQDDVMNKTSQNPVALRSCSGWIFGVLLRGVMFCDNQCYHFLRKSNCFRCWNNVFHYGFWIFWAWTIALSYAWIVTMAGIASQHRSSVCFASAFLKRMVLKLHLSHFSESFLRSSRDPAHALNSTKKSAEMSVITKQELSN